MHNFWRFLVSLLGTVYSQPSIIMIAPCKKSIILISIVRSTLKQRGTGGKVPGWTRWKARAPLSAQMATHPRSPLLPPLHHTRQQPTHQMLGQCLTASGASLWRAASPSASSDLVSSHLISSNLIWSSLISSDIWSGRMPPDAHRVIRPSDGRLSWKRPHHIFASNINQQFRVQKYFRPLHRNVFANIFDLHI